MAMIFCSKCGNQISDKAVKCPHCGSANLAFQQQQLNQQPMQNQYPQNVQNNAKPNGSKVVPLLIGIIAVLLVGCGVLAFVLLNKDSDRQGVGTGYDNPANQLFSNNDTEKPNENDIFEEKQPQTSVKEDPVVEIKPEPTKEPEVPVVSKYSVILTFESIKNIAPGTKFNTDILIDGNTLCTLSNGETKTLPTLSLEYGVHTIRLQKSDDSDFYSDITFIVEGDMKATYKFKKHYGVMEKFSIEK